MSVFPEESVAGAGDFPKGPKQEVMCSGDSYQLPDQPGFCGGSGIFTGRGTKSYPAAQEMLEAADVAGTYQDPWCSSCTLCVKPIPTLGCLCMIQFCGFCPVACCPAPFNCCCACHPNGPKAFPCLPQCNCWAISNGLDATWFCLGPQCWNWSDKDTMQTSYMCCCAKVHRKIKQGTILF